MLRYVCASLRRRSRSLSVMCNDFDAVAVRADVADHGGEANLAQAAPNTGWKSEEE